MNRAYVVLDESGSMAGQEARVVSGLNEYVSGLPDDAHVTVFCFDSNRWRQLFSGIKEKWKTLTADQYQPGAMTPLYDSIGRALVHAEEKSRDGDKVMVMVDTDGYENASREHTLDSIKAAIDAKKAQGWEFLFIASGLTEQAAREVEEKTSAALGVNTMVTTHAKRRETYTSASVGTRSYFEK